MKTFLISILLHCTCLFFAQDKYVLVVHGGAGTITRESLTKEREKAYHEALKSSLLAGYEKIKQGKTSVEAVESALIVLENSPLFNAGKGAVLTSKANAELDASIMRGRDRMAGAVAGLTTIKNPIKAAIAVMNHSPHVMLVGKGGEEFAELQGLEKVPNTYFITPSRQESLKKYLNAQKNSHKVALSQSEAAQLYDSKFGTVGAVALDAQGNLAAGTSTGGMTGKKFGRVGDSPIIGSGTYANAQVGVSATGWGEFFIRTSAASNLAAQMKYLGLPVLKAAENTIEEIGDLGGDGGIIALDKNGNIAMPFNTEGMYRGAITEGGKIEIYIYK